MINPNVVEGQIAGGTVQGIGGALLENIVYDDHGNPLASTFVDYLLPTATEVPPIEFGHVEIPGPGVGGYKGVGEGGAIGSTPAVINAINDALAPLGVTLTRLPASPAAIVDLIEQATRRKGPKVELNNEFRVAVSVDEAWEVLTDVERVAPCIPGAQLLSVDGDDFTGAVKVKVGPITVPYKGDASVRGEGCDRPASGDQGRRQGDTRSRQRRGAGDRRTQGRRGLHPRGYHHRPLDLRQGRTVRPRCARRRVDQADRAVRRKAGGRRAGRCGRAGAAATPLKHLRRRRFRPPLRHDEAIDLLSLVAVPLAKRSIPPVGFGLVAGLVIGYVLGRRRA